MPQPGKACRIFLGKQMEQACGKPKRIYLLLLDQAAQATGIQLYGGGKDKQPTAK
ncbi:hypothetical protein D3C71_1379310 [compost metagenome]